MNWTKALIRQLTRLALPLTVAVGVLASAAPAGADGPPLTVPKDQLEAAFECPVPVEGATKAPIMLVPPTGATGEQAYAIGAGAFEALGHPVCYIDLPDVATADIQTSAQFLVYGVRREARLASRKVSVFGISQGGLLPRFALTFWPDLRRRVGDVLAAGGTQRGTSISLAPNGQPCSAVNPCPPAFFQQVRGSKLLRALKAQPDETPGRVSYTTVRSLTDEMVQPQGGRRPTSALEGASNVLIQDVCPGRSTTHIGTGLDSVTFAAFADALSHRGPAKASRLPADVCGHLYAPGLDEAATSAILAGTGAVFESQTASVPKVAREPRVKRRFLP